MVGIQRCECCQEECEIVFPFYNEDTEAGADCEWVCGGCADALRDASIDLLFRCPVVFEPLGNGHVIVAAGSWYPRRQKRARQVA